MFRNSEGQEVNPEECIFPLVTYIPNRNIWRCLGTAFFITPNGGFVTAKHVFFDNDRNYYPTLYGVQTTHNGEHHLRILRHLVLHENADIGVGMLGARRVPVEQNIQPEITPYFQLDFGRPANGDTIRTFAFPLTEREDLGNGQVEFEFFGTWSPGNITGYHPEGSLMVRNECYQTSMQIDFGASGGPVLKNDLVIAINSSAGNVPEGAEPESYISPIDLILDLQVPNGDGRISIRELVHKGNISGRFPSQNVY